MVTPGEWEWTRYIDRGRAQHQSYIHVNQKDKNMFLITALLIYIAIIVTKIYNNQ